MTEINSDAERLIALLREAGHAVVAGFATFDEADWQRIIELAQKQIVWVWLPEQVYRVCDLLGRVGRGAQRLLGGDWSSVRNVFRNR